MVILALVVYEVVLKKYVLPMVGITL